MKPSREGHFAALLGRGSTIAYRFLAIAGLIMSMHGNASAAPAFILKAPEAYFSTPATLALLRAARANDLELARKLVAEGADPNDEGPKDNPYNRIRLLHYAIAANDTNAIRVLVAVGADPEQSVQGFGPALLFAVTLDNSHMLSTMFDLRPVNSLSNRSLVELLYESVIQNRPGCLDLLLRRGAPIDTPDSAGATILITAMDAQNYDLAEALIRRGASVLIEMKSGLTAAYSVQYHLSKYQPGSPTYNKVLAIKALMEERGAVFPAPSPKEVRARRAAKP